MEDWWSKGRVLQVMERVELGEVIECGGGEVCW